MTIEQMRTLLKLPADTGDSEVIAAYGAYEREREEAEAVALTNATASFDPWRAAVDVLFNGPGSSPATFDRASEDLREIRIIRLAPDRLTRFADTQILPATHVVHIRKSDVPQPEVGDVLLIGDETLTLSLDPSLDVEGLTWTCGAEVAP